MCARILGNVTRSKLIELPSITAGKLSFSVVLIYPLSEGRRLSLSSALYLGLHWYCVCILPTNFQDNLSGFQPLAVPVCKPAKTGSNCKCVLIVVPPTETISQDRGNKLHFLKQRQMFQCFTQFFIRDPREPMSRFIGRTNFRLR